MSALVVGATAMGGVTTGGVAGSASSSVTISGGSPAAQRAVQARRADQNRVRLRFESRGLRVTDRSDAHLDCAGVAYGEVVDWFRHTPCVVVVRTTFEIKDRGRTTAVVAVAWVDMPDEQSATRLRDVVDRHGTGNIRELGAPSWRYRGLRFTGQHYRSWRQGSLVVNVQVEPVGRSARAVDVVTYLDLAAS